MPSKAVPSGSNADASTGTPSLFVRHFPVATLSTLVNRMRQGLPPSGELCVTFDDGYADNFEYALPILREHSLPALFYVTSGFIGSTVQAFWDAEAQIESRWMSWDQLSQLVGAGHELGAHTVNHADLSQLTAVAVEQELAGVGCVEPHLLLHPADGRLDGSVNRGVAEGSPRVGGTRRQ